MHVEIPTVLLEDTVPNLHTQSERETLSETDEGRAEQGHEQNSLPLSGTEILPGRELKISMRAGPQTEAGSFAVVLNGNKDGVDAERVDEGGECVHGPFSVQSMLDWVSAGYFLGAGGMISCEFWRTSLSVSVLFRTRTGMHMRAETPVPFSTWRWSNFCVEEIFCLTLKAA